MCIRDSYGTDDLTAFEHVPGIGTVADGEYTFEPQKAEEYVNLDYTPTAPDGTVYTEAAWGADVYKRQPHLWRIGKEGAQRAEKAETLQDLSLIHI